MKMNGILNSDISHVLSYLRHTDQICIGDCGLPIPEGVICIDLTVKLGVPSFIDVLDEILKNLKVEKMILAEEIISENDELLKKIGSLFDAYETGFKTEVNKQFVSHESFKVMSQNSKAVIRTGEDTPYANIILQSGCIF
jgi:D-ribose pyranase